MSDQEAKISVIKSSKGKKLVSLEYQKNGKPKHLNVTTDLDKFSFDLNGSDCVFSRSSDGKIEEIKVDGKSIFKYSNKSSENVSRNQYENNRSSRNSYSQNKYSQNSYRPPQRYSNNYSQVSSQKAFAPYNFIPLNETVVKSEYKNLDSIPKHSSYEKEKLSGFINVKITTKTPFYIRNTRTIEDDKNYESPNFFSPTGKARIPGSSLRGLIRNLVEIASYGKFTSFTDKNLFYRNIGDNFYKKTMIKNDSSGTSNNSKPGFLTKEKGNFYIYPSKTHSKTNVYRIDFNHIDRRINGIENLKLDEFTFKKIYFKPTEPIKQIYRHKKIPEKYGLNYAFVSQLSLTPKENYIEGYIISSGNFSRKKHMHWIIGMPDFEKKIKLSKHLIENYKNDEQRVSKANLINMLNKTLDFVPCFYITDQDKIIALGNTGLFRLPYKLSLKNQIPDNLLDNSILDIPTAIFGDKDKMSSRVFFEDAECENSLQDISMEEVSPKILGSPKPPTFQHYLEQPFGYKTSKNNLSTWNDQTKIRGYKQYWHRNNNDWSEEKVVRTDKIHTSIKPIKPGVEFNGKIRFDNLSAVELGSLLFVINLPKNHFHKLGMAKPLGLGSVQIEPTLEIIDRTSQNGRYSKLFENDDWFLGKTNEPTKKDFYIKAFEKYILQHIGENVSSLWETKRIKELKTMLSWENTNIPNWLEKTRYMLIENKEISDRRNQNEYKDRPVLKTPTETVE